jgi:hypothetical protein
MAIDNREKRASVVGVNRIAGPSPTPNSSKDQEWRQQVGYGYSGILVFESIFGDLYFNVNPNLRPTAGDVYTNTRYNVGGDVWFDVLDESSQDTAWDILNAFLQTTAWDILNENTQPIAWDILNTFVQDVSWGIATGDLTQDVAWRIFPAILFFMTQYHVNPIAFNFKTADGNTVEEQYNLIQALKINTPVQFTYQIKQPVPFTFGVSTVLSGEDPTENRRA